MSEQVTTKHNHKFIIEKPTWPTNISKEQHSIYTVDIHPDGTRFAIALFKDVYLYRTIKLFNSDDNGSGSSSIIGDDNSKTMDQQQISLSNTVQLDLVVNVNPKEELIAKLDHHTLTINCLRFSPNGRFISCASDDQKISLYQYEQHVMPSMDQKESWRCVKLFGGHTRDVLCIDWSRDSKYLASCGVDNTVCVYDVEQRVHLQTLSMDGIVKGVIWDPIGKYLLAQAEKQVVVWSSSTWSETTSIVEPFSHSMGDNMAYRPTWSPDGEFIVVVNGLSGKNHVAPIVSRKEFKHTNEFSGHKDSVIVAKYNPVIFEDPEDEKHMVTVVALGSMDSSISIWATNAGRPLFIISDLVREGITDIAWNKNGNVMLCSSSDGSVTVIRFPTDFFGKPMPQYKVNSLMREKYGEFSSSRSLLEAPLIDSFIDLNDPEPFDEFSEGLQQSVIAQQPIDDGIPIIEKQKETRTKDGKRRIQPLVVRPVANVLIPQRTKTAVNTDSSSKKPSQETTIAQPNAIQIMENRMNEGSNIINSALTLNTAVDKPVVTSAKSVQVVSKKRDRVEESTENEAKRRREDPVLVDQFAPEPLYMKINDKEEVKCSVEGEISYLHNGVCSWNANIGEAPINAAVNSNFVAVTGKLNSVHIFSRTGRRLLPPLILDSVAQHICCNKDRHLVVVTSEKMLYLWDVLRTKCIAQSSADHIVYRNPRQNRFIDDVGVTATGVPVVTLSNGESYSYNHSLKTWLCIADSHASLSSFVSSATHLYDNDHGDEIYENLTYRYLKTRAARLAEQCRIEAVSNDETVVDQQKRSLQTIEDLEIGLASTAALDDDSGYLHFLKAYARHLSRTNNVDRFAELCNSLLGPVRKQGTSDDWNPFVGKMPKRTMLSKLLQFVGKDLALQRVIIEYRDMLNQLAE